MRLVHFGTEPFHGLPYAVGPAVQGPADVLPFCRGTVDRLPEGIDAIIVTSDLQGVVPTLDGRPPMLLGEAVAIELRAMRDRGELPPRDATVALLAGDLQPSADVGDVSAVWHAMADACRWVAGVAGNHDAFGTATSAPAARLAMRRPGCHLLDEDEVDIDGLRIAGVSGMVGQSAGPWERNASDYTAVVARLAAGSPDVLICHDGPNVAGTLVPGWPSVRRALEAAQPTLLVRGHDHWDVPLATLANGSQALNVEGRVAVLTRPARVGEQPT